MHPSRNLLRDNGTRESEAPSKVPQRGASSLGFYRSTPLTAGPRPITTALDFTAENERLPVGSSDTSSLSPAPTRNSSEELSRTKSDTEGKTRKFPKFKLSLTAPPPKPKPKQPKKVPPPMRAGGRGGAGNIRKIIPDNPPAATTTTTTTTTPSGSSENSKSNTVPVSIANVKARQPLPEATDPEHGSLCVSPEGREMAIPRMKLATSGRGGAGNLHQHVLEDGVFKRVIAHEDVLIRQRRVMQADQNARGTGRGGVGNIKRSDDDPDLEHSAGSRSGSSASRGFVRRGASTSTRSSGTTSSSGMSIDISTSFPEPATHSNFHPLTPLLDEAHEPPSPVLEQGGAGVLVERDSDAHLERALSPPLRTNSLYAIPSGATTRNIQSEEVRERVGPRSPSPPHLYLPPYHPLRSHQNKYDEGRRLVTNPDTTAAPRPQDAPALDGARGQSYSHSSRMSPRNEIPRPSPGRSAQYPVYPTSSQRRFEETGFHQFGVMGCSENRAGYTQGVHHSYQGTLASTNIVSPSTASSVSVQTPPIWRSGGNKGPRHYSDAAEGFHLGSGPNVERESGANEDHKADIEVVSKPQEEGGLSPYSDIFFSRPMAILLEADSANGSGAGTPLSDDSSILVPWQALLNATSSVVKQKKIQDQPTNSQLAGTTYIPRTKPTSRPRSQSKEAPLHCDELTVPPRKPLSRMEKAILRRIEFGPNVDFSKAQPS